MARRVIKFARLALGWLLVIAGAITVPTPLPIGYVLILIGLSILVHESRFVRTRIRRLRERYPGIGNWLNRIKHYAPGFARRLIELTDPVRRGFRRPTKSVPRARLQSPGSGEN
jgi:hypothetical protein